MIDLTKLRFEDRHEISKCYTLYFSSVQKHILENNGSLDDAKDVFQDSLITLLNKLKDQSFELSCTVHTFLYSIARNLWLNELRRRKKLSPLLIQDHASEEQISEEILEEAQKNQFLIQQMQKLKIDCQKVLSSFYLHSKSLKEIALDMKLDEDYIRLKRFRCMNMLKKLISNKPS